MHKNYLSSCYQVNICQEDTYGENQLGNNYQASLASWINIARAWQYR